GPNVRPSGRCRSGAASLSEAKRVSAPVPTSIFSTQPAAGFEASWTPAYSLPSGPNTTPRGLNWPTQPAGRLKAPRNCPVLPSYLSISPSGPTPVIGSMSPSERLATYRTLSLRTTPRGENGAWGSSWETTAGRGSPVRPL